MKKCLAIAVYAMIIISFSAMVSANSGPVFWKGYPSWDIMAVEENSPIRVENEHLVFDFSAGDDSSYSIKGNVTATYEMLNPTDDRRSVKMAFPFVGRLDSLMAEDIYITADDNILPYELYIGNAVMNSYSDPYQDDNKGTFDFSFILSGITHSSYSAKNFTEDQKGKLYVIEVRPTTAQRINLVVDFDFDHEKTKVLTNGFNGYDRRDEKTRITAWCDETEILEIYVLGEDIDLDIDAYTDGEISERTDLFTYQITAQELEVRQYLMKYTKNDSNVKDQAIISDIQLYNLYAKALDEYFTVNMGFASEHDLIAQENDKRILTLVYTVDFLENSRKKVGISYAAAGTMDRTQTAEALYSFDYILNPAGNWNDFKDLNIKVITPDEAPYIVKSNVEWTKEEDKVYSAAFTDLPDDDISFTLYRYEKIRLRDRVAGSLQNSFGYFTPIVTGVMALFLLGIITVILIHKKRR